LTELFLALDRDAAEGSPWGALYGECLGAAFTAELLKQYNVQCESAREGSVAPDRVDEAINYIHDNLATDLSLTTLAEVSGCSVRRFMDLFKRRTGCSPHQYVLRERISVSRALLTQRDISVTEVAFRVGFQEQSHFSKLFRRLTGTTPSTYQRRSRR
jgi:AraC family transcriptional regulator